MAYLTFKEYAAFGYEEFKGDDFDRLVIRASDILDNQTRHFYKFNDLETDIKFRKNQFKKAIAVQVEHMATLGAISTTEIDNLVSWSLDGISVSNGSSGDSDGNNKSIVSAEALEMLSMTGLLYRGAC